MAISTLLVIGLVLLDQITKYLVRTQMTIGESITVLPFLHITYVTNTGVSFGMFQGANTVFIVITFLVLAGFVYWLIKNYRTVSVWMRTAMLLIIAGALGNLIDRIALGSVVDFIHVSYGAWYFPMFNVADSCISVGGTILFFIFLFTKEKNSEHAASPVTPDAGTPQVPR
jgi:signal peptidase II